MAAAAVAVAVLAGSKPPSAIEAGSTGAAPSSPTASTAEAAGEDSAASSTAAAGGPDEIRADFLQLAAAERELDVLVPDVAVLPDLAGGVCSTLAATPSSAGVWAAAAGLEQGAYGFPDLEAWGFVDLAVTVYCPQHVDLVTTTTASAVA